MVNQQTLQVTYQKESHSIHPNRNANIYVISKICAEARTILDKAIRQLISVGAEIVYVGMYCCKLKYVF